MHKKTMEAALFISSTPLTLDQLARITGINSLGHVKELIESLQEDYEGKGIEIFNSADGYTMQVRPQMLPKVAHLTPYSDLAEGPKRTLALVTLKEPVRQSEIIKTQGNKAYSYIKDLKKRGLILTEKEGHTKILKLTQEFERYFGEEKAKIKEQLERHLEAAGKEGEPVYDSEEPTEPGKDSQEFMEEKKPAKEKATGTPLGTSKVSVIKEGAAMEVTGEKSDEFGEDDDEPEDDETEEKSQAKKGMKPSHENAFKEIE
ncbi:MAG: SMC-Scp complex subunit ScpB [Candidatus Aenigmarchaeota archaeon]|nr:SMC-Scp complex subunit ScpB [Candidatus Aenigmarchaeota archaeon]